MVTRPYRQRWKPVSLSDVARTIASSHAEESPLNWKQYEWLPPPWLRSDCSGTPLGLSAVGQSNGRDGGGGRGGGVGGGNGGGDGGGGDGGDDIWRRRAQTVPRPDPERRRERSNHLHGVIFSYFRARLLRTFCPGRGCSGRKLKCLGLGERLHHRKQCYRNVAWLLPTRPRGSASGPQVSRRR